MAIVTLRLPEVKATTEKRLGNCLHYGCTVLQRWGSVTKPVIDSHLPWVLIYRYRCTGYAPYFSSAMVFCLTIYFLAGISLPG
jgi:hypothetical protein